MGLKYTHYSPTIRIFSPINQKSCYACVGKLKRLTLYNEYFIQLHIIVNVAYITLMYLGKTHMSCILELIGYIHRLYVLAFV